MAILDTSVVIDRIKGKRMNNEDITAVTLVEFPRIIYYKYFNGGILFPIKEDFLLVHKIQLRLLELGLPQAFADLLIAAIVVNRNEELITRDEDFAYISQATEKLGITFKLKNRLNYYKL